MRTKWSANGHMRVIESNSKIPLCITAIGNIFLKLFMAPLDTIKLLAF